MTVQRFENPPYYITAYGLAVKRGFKGTLDEWIASLKGNKVELRHLEDKIQWRWSPDAGATEESAEEGTGTTAEESSEELKDDYEWHDLMDIAEIRSQVEETLRNELMAGYQPKGDYVLQAQIPKALPNPATLTFTGAATGTYDGSANVIINIPIVASDGGSGGAISVCGVSPDENGNVILGASDVKALSTDGGIMNGNIDMGGHKLSGLNAPTEDTEAVTKKYADDTYALKEDAVTMAAVSVTLSSSGWSEGTQTVNASGVTADAEKCVVITTAAAGSLEAYLDCGIVCSAQGAGTLTFSCSDTPTEDVMVNVLILQKGG